MVENHGAASPLVVHVIHIGILSSGRSGVHCRCCPPVEENQSTVRRHAKDQSVVELSSRGLERPISVRYTACFWPRRWWVQCLTRSRFRFRFRLFEKIHVKRGFSLFHVIVVKHREVKFPTRPAALLNTRTCIDHAPAESIHKCRFTEINYGTQTESVEYELHNDCHEGSNSKPSPMNLSQYNLSV